MSASYIIGLIIGWIFVLIFAGVMVFGLVSMIRKFMNKEGYLSACAKHGGNVGGTKFEFSNPMDPHIYDETIHYVPDSRFYIARDFAPEFTPEESLSGEMQTMNDIEKNALNYKQPYDGIITQLAEEDAKTDREYFEETQIKGKPTDITRLIPHMNEFTQQ